MDTNMDECKCELICIHYACVACTYRLDHAWINGKRYPEQPRYAYINKCKYICMLGHYNEWIIIQVVMNEL